jgi:hypothetical protein
MLFVYLAVPCSAMHVTQLAILCRLLPGLSPASACLFPSYLLTLLLQKMTYAQQLQMYEEEVMKKRLEEMTESEVARLMAEVETEKGAAAPAAAKPAVEQQQQ